MSLHCLIPSSDWDSVIFKVLASTDTGKARGHVGGFLVTTALRPFFPGLPSGLTSAKNPTIDKRITVELFDRNRYLATTNSRYQIQTRRGMRKPEYRVTDQLAPLLNLAIGGDVLLIQRHIDSLEYFKFTLVPRTSPEFASIKSMIGNRRWGVLAESKPVTASDLERAQEDESTQEAAPFNLFDLEANTGTTLVKRIARSLVFRTKVINLYSQTCSFCGQALKSSTGLLELDAAHVVPRSVYGSDDARNGLALCKRHHWAFDHGLVAVSKRRTIIVASSAAVLPENRILKKLNGTSIREASSFELMVDPTAFDWHRKNILQK